MKISVADAMRRYPLRVYFPMPGEYRLLVIHTEQEQGQFLLAKSEEGLERLLRAYWKKEKFLPQVKELWHIEMVSPPLETREKYATSKYEWDLSMFRGMLARIAGPFVTSGALKAPLRPCPEYKPDPDAFGEDEKPDAYAKQNHICCLACKDTKVVYDCDVEDLFLQKYDVYQKLEKIGHRPYARVDARGRKILEPRALDPQAKEPELGRTIYIVTAHYGPHAKGNVIEELQRDYISTDGFPLFFFQGEKLSDIPAWARKMDKEYRDRRKKSDVDYKKQVKDERKSYADQQLAILKELFA